MLKKFTVIRLVSILPFLSALICAHRVQASSTAAISAPVLSDWSGAMAPLQPAVAHCSADRAALTNLASGRAAKVSDYVTYQRNTGSSPTQGKWDLDFVQLIPRPGHPLSSGDLRINAELKKAADEGMCLPSDDAKEAGFSESSTSTKVTFVSDRLLALTTSYDVSCAGAAHPSNGLSSVIYDRALGQAIDISTGLPVTDSGSTATSKAFKLIVLREMAKKAAKEKAARGDHDCDQEYDAANLSFFPDGIALSSKSISVDLSTAHVDQACGFTTVIPLSKFLPIAKKGSVLEELAKAAAAKR